MLTTIYLNLTNRSAGCPQNVTNATPVAQALVQGGEDAHDQGITSTLLDWLVVTSRGLLVCCNKIPHLGQATFKIHNIMILTSSTVHAVHLLLSAVLFSGACLLCKNLLCCLLRYNKKHVI